MESINVALARLEEKVDDLSVRFDKVEKSINGNGNPGILARLNSLEGGLKALTFIILVGVSIFCAFV